MNKIRGNLIDLAYQGKFDIIVHGCNCFNTMGSGIAKEIKQRCPEAYQEDYNTVLGDKSKLGTYTIATCGYDGLDLDNSFLVVNMYTQYRYGTDKVHVEYEAIRKGFRTLAKEITEFPKEDRLTVAYPKIGCGLAGGDWNIVSKIIDEELKGIEHTLVEL